LVNHCIAAKQDPEKEAYGMLGMDRSSTSSTVMNHIQTRLHIAASLLSSIAATAAIFQTT